MISATSPTMAGAGGRRVQVLSVRRVTTSLSGWPFFTLVVDGSKPFSVTLSSTRRTGGGEEALERFA